MGNHQSTGRSQGHGGQFQNLEHIISTEHDHPTLEQEQHEDSSRRRIDHRRSLLNTSRYSGIFHPFTRRPIPSLQATQDDYAEMSANVVRNEHEHSPLVGMEDSNTTTESSAGMLARSTSTVSRLGSRLLPENVMRGLLSSGEETAEEGEALRQGTIQRRLPSVFERQAPSTNNIRFPFRGTIRRRLESRTDPRRTIRGPFPITYTEHQRLELDANDQDVQTSREASSSDVAAVNISPRRARLSRFRNSLSFPLSGIFSSSQDRTAIHLPRSPTPHPNQAQTNGDSEYLLGNSSASPRGHGHDDSPHELDAVEPESRNMLSTSRITSGMTSIRRFPHGLRSRSTRLIRRGEHPPLSQVLQLAAAAIAAQLSGHAGPGADGSRPSGGEAFDGSIQNFVQTLQDAASAQAGGNIDLNAADGDLPPVNFMRVFQFPNDENGTPIASMRNRDSNHVDPDSQDRSVTLVLVGVRSMPNVQDGTTNENGTLGPSLDTLLSLPFLPPANVLRNGSSGALFRRSDTRIRESRRHSMTNFNFPAQYETQRHQRTRTISGRGSTEQSLLSPNQNVSIPQSESPPGPSPPPSTPADMRSGHATPIRRPSSASGVQTPLLPYLQEDNGQDDEITTPESSFTPPRQRRRSDSEFARRPELGSGAARRNGVVEPDRPAPGAGRSWLIYVVGTNVSPDHPAFTMPSLFTDNPSYEDMQMLSTLLGPVKPPVATQNDVDSAGGNYRIELLEGGGLVAQPVNNEDFSPISIANGDRCLICLCDYETSESVRQLDSCRHLFHRECIDEWLTTGRNSCPMCRGKGVQETPSAPESVPPSTIDEQTSSG